MTSTRQYWVTYRAELVDPEGKAPHESAIDVQPFLNALTRHLLSEEALTASPAVLTSSTGEIVMASVIPAPSAGYAVVLAETAFEKAITLAGGTFPSASSQSWSVARLVDFQVQEVSESDGTDERQAV